MTEAASCSATLVDEWVRAGLTDAVVAPGSRSTPLVVALARESRMLSTGTAAENREWVIDRKAFVANRSFKTADDVYDAMLAHCAT